MLVLTKKEEGIYEQSFFSSSNVLYVKYRIDIRKMSILFESGRIYLYHDVPRHIFLQIQRADSQGKKIRELLTKNNMGKKLYQEELFTIIESENINLVKEIIYEAVSKEK